MALASPVLAEGQGLHMQPISQSEEDLKMTVLYAQPYDISAVGFDFKSVEEYNKLSAENKNEDGYIVEEYEIQCAT